MFPSAFGKVPGGINFLASPQTGAGTAGATIAANKAVAYNGSNQLILADSTDATKKIVGITVAGASNGAPISFVTSGPVYGILSGAKTGQAYYLGTAGNLTTTPPATTGNEQMLVGYALNGSDLYVQILDWGTVS